MWNRTSNTKGLIAEDHADFDAAQILDQLDAYKKRDPGYETSIENFAKAEAENVDPVEGKTYLIKHTASTGSIERKSRRSLNARLG